MKRTAIVLGALCLVSFCAAYAVAGLAGAPYQCLLDLRCDGNGNRGLECDSTADTCGIDVDGDGVDECVCSASGFTVPAVANPCRDLVDSDTTDEDTSAQACANCTTLTTGDEECDYTIGTQRAGVMTTCFTIDGDGGITVGCADNASLTVTTDGTGTGEVVLPAGSIDSTEVLDATLTAADMAATMTFADAFLMDFGANVDSATEGLICPGHATDCSSATAEGQFCWEHDAETLWIGNGTAAVRAGNELVFMGMWENTATTGQTDKPMINSNNRGPVTLPIAGTLKELRCSLANWSGTTQPGSLSTYTTCTNNTDCIVVELYDSGSDTGVDCSIDISESQCSVSFTEAVAAAGWVNLAMTTPAALSSTTLEYACSLWGSFR